MPLDNDETVAGDLLATALAYALAGLPVLPLDGKVPRTSNGLTGASTDVQVIAEWWRRWPAANIGIATGAVSGYVVLDVDPRHGGLASLETLKRKHGLPRTAQVLTGSGGQHLWFTHPGYELPNSAGQLGAGLDVRGDGGYVVVPPSLHESGNPYKWLRERGQAVSWPNAFAPHKNGTAPKVAEVIPSGQRNQTLASLAGTMRRRGMSETAIAAALAEENSARCQPPLQESEVRAIAGSVSRYAPDPDTAISVVAAYSGHSGSLDDVVTVFRKWLHLPDPGALYVTLAAVVANRLPGDPLWLLLVAASSSGKTEILVALGGLDEVVAAATMTEAALLSGSPKKDHAAGASGGLLRTVGDYGILTLKDFGSVLSMHRDARAAVLAALREIYDGSWDRHVGIDGGKTLHWDGKLGLIGGITTVVDSHHAVMDSLGSRFAFYRVDVDERAEQGMRALEHRGGARTMRDELRAVVNGFFQGLELPNGDTLSHGDKQQLVDLADLVTMARSPVERDRQSRDIEMIPDPEAPARFAIMLAGLLEGLRVIGLADDDAWTLVVKTAFDSMPAQRRRAIEHLSETGTATTKTAALALGLPTITVRRTLEDLAAHRVVDRHSGGDGKADNWQLSAWAKERYAPN